MKDKLNFILLLSAAAYCSVAKAALQDDANVQVLEALCTIVELGGTRAKLTTTQPPLSPAADSIMELNMTASEQAWIELFRKEQGKDDTRDYDASKLPKETDWEGKWEAWKQQAGKLLKKDARTTLEKKHKINMLSERQKASLRLALEPIAEGVQHLIAKAKDEGLQQKIMTEKDMQKQFNQAIYGTDAEPGDSAMVPSLFTSAMGGSRQAACVGDETDGKAKTILAVLVCLGAKDTNKAGDIAKACTGTAPTENWTGANANPSAALQKEIANMCNRKGHHKVTSTDLKQRLKSIAAKFKYDSAAGYTGAHTTGECTGSNNAGICVKYTSLAAAAMSPLEAVGWLKTLRTLADKLERHEDAVKELERVNEEINRKGSAAQAVVYAALAQKQSHEKQINTAAQTQTSDGKDCTQHKTNTTCTADNNCKWEGTEETKGKCKPKDGEGQTNTAGKEGAAGKPTTEKCKWKSQTDCKDGCKWNGKDGNYSSLHVNMKCL